MTDKHPKLIIVILVLLLLIALIINQIYLLSQNTLENNDKWISMKREVQMGLLGANIFYSDKVALRQSKLNLGAWHGFQGVIYKEKINPGEIEFDFFLTDNSYFYFIFNKNAENYLGIRVSVNKAFNNVLVSAYINGGFTKKTELPLNNIKKDSWNRFRIIFQNNQFSFFINRKFIGNFNEVLLHEQYFGFRGSYNPVFIDNVLVKQKGSNVIIKESFSNKKKQFQSGISIFLAVLLLNVMIGLILAIRKRNFKKIVFSIILLNILLLFFSIASLSFYYYANEIKTRYPKVHGLFRNIMKEEEIFVNREAEYINRRIMNDYKTEVSENINRILFIGTSQTVGAGAGCMEETFVRLIEDILNRSGTGQYECINAGVHGSNSHELIRYYENSWIKFKPKVSVINLSNNDQDKEAFRLSMQRFIDLDKNFGIGTIFILEANSREVSSDLLSFHEIMKELGKKDNILTIDLHNYLLEKDDIGILWWDGVHMTSYGQKLTAEFISSKILTFLNDQ
jgi:lysophospholipase L1-like esterase